MVQRRYTQVGSWVCTVASPSHKQASIYTSHPRHLINDIHIGRCNPCTQTPSLYYLPYLPLPCLHLTCIHSCLLLHSHTSALPQPISAQLTTPAPRALITSASPPSPPTPSWLDSNLSVVRFFCPKACVIWRTGSISARC